MKSVGQTHLLFRYWATDGGISADEGMDGKRRRESERKRAKRLEKVAFSSNILVSLI